MTLYLLENSFFYDFACSGMSGMLTNMFVYNYKQPHHQSFTPPSMYTPSLPWSRQMAPKPKPNTCLATAQAPPDSCKRQGSNVDQPKTKRTRRKTNEVNEANDNDDDLNKSEDEQEAVDWVEEERTTPQHQEVVNEGVQ